MNRIDKKFQDLKKEGRKAFIAFLTAGFPSLSLTKDFILELEKNQVDIIELGMPFSDPLADGPIIQQTSQYSLRQGINIDKILNLVKKIRHKSNIPICLMSYFNPIFAYGLKYLVDRVKEAGIDGLIIPDLPPEETEDLIPYCRKRKINLIFFLSPTSSIKRIKLISKVSRGFIYYVSLTGVTGTRDRLAHGITSKIRMIKRYTKIPVCVGFGVSKPSHTREIAKVADGVIVGSAILKKIQSDFKNKNIVKNIGRYVAKFIRILE